MSSFYDEEELKQLGFKRVGENVKISRKASIYGAGNISIGNNVRIDDFCILSGCIEIGNFVHIAAYTSLFAGTVGIIMKDFSCLSSRCAVYAISDDYSGNSLTNPMVPDQYRKVQESQVVLEKHVLVGTGSTILPGVILGEGTSVGAMSLINKSLEPWGMYVGIPCKKIREREKNILKLEEEFLGSV